MKNVKKQPYLPVELEIITFECNDIVTASGYVSVPDEDTDW